jgi:hypothetical protein
VLDTNRSRSLPTYRHSIQSSSARFHRHHGEQEQDLKHYSVENGTHPSVTTHDDHQQGANSLQTLDHALNSAGSPGNIVADQGSMNGSELSSLAASIEGFKTALTLPSNIQALNPIIFNSFSSSSR